MQRQQQQQQRQNGSSPTDGPRDELDMYARVTESAQDNPLLQGTNLGLGNYDEKYKWQQIRSYRKGLKAYISFSRVLTERAIHETKVKLAREGFTHFNESKQMVDQWDPHDDDDVDEDQSSWISELERGNQIWNSLDDDRSALSEKQVAAIIEKTGISTDWMPIYWQMVSGRHEVSRSEDAELIRDLLTGIKHLRNDQQDRSSGGILGN